MNGFYFDLFYLNKYNFCFPRKKWRKSANMRCEYFFYFLQFIINILFFSLFKSDTLYIFILLKTIIY